MTKMLSAGSWVPISGSFDSGSKPDGPGEFAVVDPLSQHELVLVFDVRVDELKEHPALDAVVGLAWIIGRPVRQAATNQPVRIVAAAGHPLARDWLAPWIDAAYVCADGTADPLRISRTIGILHTRNRSTVRARSRPQGYPCPVTRREERRCAIARTSLRPAVRDRSGLCSTARSLQSPRRRSRPS